MGSRHCCEPKPAESRRRTNPTNLSRTREVDTRWTATTTAGATGMGGGRDKAKPSACSSVHKSECWDSASVSEHADECGEHEHCNIEQHGYAVGEYREFDCQPVESG